MRARRRPSGFTLIELLVVIAILSLMMGLMLPAIQRVREAANKMLCASNLKQIGLAMHNYHNDYLRLPPAIKDANVSCFTWILPYFEQDVLARQYDPLMPPTAPPNSTIAVLPLRTLLCPTMQRPELPPHPAYASYGGVVGKQFCWAHAYPPGTYPKHDGVIIPESDGLVRLTDILDGTSNTLLVGEMHFNVKDYLYTSGPYAGGPRLANTSWVWGYPTYSFGSTIVPMNKKTHTGPLFDSGIQAFRSDHSGGCNFLLADGSVHFVHERIDLTVYQAASTRRAGEVVPDGF